ncbi:MAG: thioredoxin-dependent thiol peroxidase [Spirochaetales bacterium]|jgi:thioredoxin-dependent peroxiredoxin|nr:thioredoxin-dependent thiol peroxidase [Spirochaetales bacterium]
MLNKGDKAPVISLPDETGAVISLDDFAGKKKVVYFYPKDDTPGCTTEACGFRDVYDDILAKNAVVLGISPDSSQSHVKFRDKFDLPFHLLSDVETTVIQGFGAWGEKKNYGKTYMGIIRSTFILDENNVVIEAFPKVKPADHAEEILNLL